MDRILLGWERSCASSTILRSVDINLRGAGQVIFQNNPISGLLFLAALSWGALATNVPHVAAGGICGLVTATLTALSLRADPSKLRSGIYSYNAILTGLALTYFLGPELWVLGYAMLGGAVTAIAMLGPVNAATPWRVPAHTYPFIFVSWIFLLAAYGFYGGPTESLPHGKELVTLSPTSFAPQRAVDFLSSVLHSISQIYFKDDALSALLIIAGLAVNSIAAALFAVGGALIAVVTAHLFGIESELISSGLQGFSPVLTAVAIGTVFYRPSLRVAAYAALGTAVTVVAQSALETVLTPIRLPPLSAPFDLVALLFLIHKSGLEPIVNGR